jgi:Cu-Zn family superoxide dismutase
MNISQKQLLIALSVAGLFSLAACQSMEQGTGQKATSILDSRSGSQAKGEVTLARK